MAHIINMNESLQVIAKCKDILNNYEKAVKSGEIKEVDITLTHDNVFTIDPEVVTIQFTLTTK